MIFIYHSLGSNRTSILDIMDNKENITLISVSNFIAHNYNDTNNKLVVIEGKVLNSSYGIHPKKGAYMKLHLTDVSQESPAAAIEIYMYKKAVIREKIQLDDLFGLSVAKLEKVSVHNSNGKSYDAYEITIESGEIYKQPSIWVLTKSLPLHTNDYTVLNDVKKDERHFIYGVIMSKEPIAVTRGTSFICSMKIKDKSIDSEFSLNIFLNDRTDLPEINCGDIIQCYIKGVVFNSRICGTAFVPKQCAFWSSNQFGHLIPKITTTSFAMTNAEEHIIRELREWVAQKFLHLLFVTPGKEAKPQLLGLKSLSAIREGDYFDFQCEVVEVLPLQNGSLLLRVWDGTKSASYSFYRYLSITNDLSTRHKIIVDYLVDIHVYGEHCKIALTLNDDDIILVRNVHCSTNKNPEQTNEMKLELHEGNRYGRTIIVCNSGQCNEFKRKLDNVLMSSKQLNRPLDFTTDEPLSPQFQPSFEMFTQDLNPEILQNVMERRAIDKGLHAITQRCDYEIECPSIDSENNENPKSPEKVSNVATEEVNELMDIPNADTNATNPLPPKRRGRWFFVVLEPTNQAKKSKTVDEDNDIQIEGVYPYKRNNLVIDTVDLTNVSDVCESDESSGVATTSSPVKVNRFSIDLFSNTFSLSTLETVATAKLGDKHRIRVKIRLIDPSPFDSVMNILRFECPTCNHSEKYVNNMDQKCKKCSKTDPLYSFMKCIFHFKFLVQDRTGSLPVLVTGSNAEVFFGVFGSHLMEYRQTRKEVKTLLEWLYNDNSDLSDILNCKNPWLDLIVETVNRPEGLTHCVVNTKCQYQYTPRRNINIWKKRFRNCM